MNKKQNILYIILIVILIALLIFCFVIKDYFTIIRCVFTFIGAYLGAIIIDWLGDNDE